MMKYDMEKQDDKETTQNKNEWKKFLSELTYLLSLQFAYSCFSSTDNMGSGKAEKGGKKMQSMISE